jgi:hypothetical protein
VSHAPAPIGHVAWIAGDDAQVEVGDRLPRGGPHVDADVEAVRAVPLLDQRTRSGHGGHQRLELLSARLENQVGTCRRGTTSMWPGFTGNASQRPRTRASSKATLSGAGKQEGHPPGGLIGRERLVRGA